MAVQSQVEQRSSGLNALGVPLIALLFVIAGAGLFAIVGMNIASVVSMAVPDQPFGQTLLTFLYDYGILLPVIEIGLGVYFLILGVQLFQRKVQAATWARQLLLWVGILMIVLALQAVVGSSGSPTNPDSIGIQAAIPFILGALVCIAGWWWMGNNMALYGGQETLEQASSRNAWNLLVPTIVLLIVVALRPLEKTFIASLTNDRFAGASDETVEFIGLSNYQQLLGFRIDAIPCLVDEATGGCVVDEDGNTDFIRARDYLDQGYTDGRYREVTGITLGSTRIIFSGSDPDFWDAVGNTLYFTFFSVIFELVIGLFVALVINSKFPGRGLLRTAMLVPWAIPTVVSARLWAVMLKDNTSGIFNSMALGLGLVAAPQAWLAQADTQLNVLIFIDVWKTVPFMALILLAGLQVIPGDIYEAADVDGAGKVRQFFQMTLPLLRPAIAVALVFRTLDAVRVFDLFQVLLGRSRLSMATLNYDTLVNDQQLGYASAIGVVIFIIILVFTVLYVRILGVKAE
jgi:trehalose/maltose transport system permease protein